MDTKTSAVSDLALFLSTTSKHDNEKGAEMFIYTYKPNNLNYLFNIN